MCKRNLQSEGVGDVNASKSALLGGYFFILGLFIFPLAFFINITVWLTRKKKPECIVHGRRIRVILAHVL